MKGIAHRSEASPVFNLPHLTLISLLFLLLACGKSPVPAAPSLTQGQSFPSPVMDFLATQAGGHHVLQEKVLVLNIWATWCAPCRREMPALEQLSKTLDPDRFAVIGLSVDRDVLLASEFLLQNRISFANYFDPHGAVVRQLGIKAYPETFVIAPDRLLLRRMTGLQEWDSPEMVRMLESLHGAREIGADKAANDRQP